MRSFKEVSRSAEEDLSQIRGDYKLPMDSWGEGSYLKFGGKYLHRDKSTDATGQVYTYSGPTNTLVDETSHTINSIWGGDLPFGPTIDYKLFRTFFDANPGLFTSSAADRLIETLGDDYNVVETITAGYVMASLNYGPLNIIPGIRVERTEGETRAIAVTPTATVNDKYNQFGSYEYTDWFPGINARYSFTESLQGRLGLTTAIGRPEYFQLAPTIAVSVGDNEVTVGNPDLEPQEAVNFDASLEYYFPGEGGVSVGFFRKKIDKPIFASTSVETGTFAGVPLVGADVFSFQNGTTAEVTGLEFAFQKPLTFLPSPFDGFGVNMNLTFVNGEMAVPGRAGKVQLPKQSERLASAQVYYEKYGFSARVAYSYRSAYLDIIDTSDVTGNGDIWFDELSTISVRVAYKFGDNIEVFGEGNNLNDATDYYYYNSTSRFAEAETYGRSFRFGLSYTY
jgi:TonB-dependent receptor